MTSRGSGVLQGVDPRWPILAGALAATVATAGALAWAPQLTLGTLVGVSLFLASIRWPFGVVVVMLIFGPLDFSFVTGGLKSLFEDVGGLDMNGIRLVAVSAGLGVALLADTRHHAVLRTPPVLAYAVFLGWTGLTLAVSPDPLEGLRLWFKLLWPLLIFLVVAAEHRRLADLERVTEWVLWGSVALLVTAPLYVLAGDVQVEVSGAVRLQGAGTHQNPFSFYLLVVVLLCAGRFAVRKSWWYVALAAVATLWIGLTQTRITMVAGVAAFFVIGAAWTVVGRNLRAGLTIGFVGLLALAAAAPTVLARTFVEVPSPVELIALVRDPVAAFGAVNWSGREIIWAALLAVWAGSPLTGLGLGASTWVLDATFLSEIAGVAHNEYIRLGTDSGLVGLGLGAVVAAVWIRVAARGVRRDDATRYELALPALGVLVAAAVISLTDNTIDYYTPFTQYVGFLAAGCVIAARTRA